MTLKSDHYPNLLPKPTFGVFSPEYPHRPVPPCASTGLRHVSRALACRGNGAAVSWATARVASSLQIAMGQRVTGSPIRHDPAQHLDASPHCQRRPPEETGHGKRTQPRACHVDAED